MYWYCYDVEEICSLYKDIGLHPQTVREWINNGLPTIDGGKPALIYGNHLARFLGKLNQSHKCHTNFDQMFCFKCKDAMPAYHKQITIAQDGKSIMAKARCQTCKTIMNKRYKMDDIPRLRTVFHVGNVLQLYDSASSPVNTHIHAQDETHESEPMQWDLFSYAT